MSTPRTPRFSDPDAARLAAEWVARRDRGLTASELDLFIAWQNADPQNAAEFKRLEQTWRGLDAVGEVHELDAMAEAVVARARTKRARRRRVRLASLAFATAAALVIGFTNWNVSPDRERPAGRTQERYRVLASTVQRMDLPDGSVAELNGASRIEVDFTSTVRRVTLTEGEAHFIVVENPERPFFVTAGPVTVRAVGTAFNVRLDGASIEVLVTEGKVSLENANTPRSSSVAAAVVMESPSLVQGQRAVINLSPAAPEKVAIGEVGPAEIDNALGWQSTRLVFNNTPLDEVVEGFNRYNSHRLTIGDSKIRHRALTGVFRADNLEGFVRLLKASVDVKAELRSSSETVLLPLR